MKNLEMVKQSHTKKSLLIALDYVKLIKCTDCRFCLEYMSAKNELLIFNYLKCSKNHKKGF